jgi:hypothetical protein
LTPSFVPKIISVYKEIKTILGSKIVEIMNGKGEDSIYKSGSTVTSWAADYGLKSRFPSQNMEIKSSLV